MTRKQALEIAMKLLPESTENYDEIIQKLQAIYDDMPFTKWTEEVIHDTFQQFYVEHGRYPSSKDYHRGKLPPHKSILLRFGMEFKEFSDRYYPQRRNAINPKEALEGFVKEYNKIRPYGSRIYDEKRDKSLPCWYTVARANGVTCWSRLLELAGVEIYRKHPQLKRYNVTTENDIDDFDREIAAIDA